MGLTKVVFWEVGKGPLAMDQFQQAIAWCREQFGPEYLVFHDLDTMVWTTRIHFASLEFRFKDENHALLFKLTWGGQ